MCQPCFGVVVAGHLLHWPPVLTTVAGPILCFGMRLVALAAVGVSLQPLCPSHMRRAAAYDGLTGQTSFSRPVNTRK